MKKIRLFVTFFAAGAMMIIAGCKSNGTTSSSATDPAKAAQLVTAANQILVPRIALIAVMPSDTSAFDLSSAKSLYSEALTDDPDNLDAHFGMAITEVLTLFSDPSVASLENSGAISLSMSAVLPVMKNGGVQQFARSASAGIQEKITLLTQPSVAARMMLAKSQAAQLPSYYQSIVESKVLPVLADAILQLQRVAQNTSYQFLITPQMEGVNDGPTYRIDLTEIDFLLAVVQFLDADASLFVAYDIDYNSATAASVTQAWQSSSPFLALRTNGAQRMKDTRY